MRTLTVTTLQHQWKGLAKTEEQGEEEESNAAWTLHCSSCWMAGPPLVCAASQLFCLFHQKPSRDSSNLKAARKKKPVADFTDANLKRGKQLLKPRDESHSCGARHALYFKANLVTAEPLEIPSSPTSRQVLSCGYASGDGEATVSYHAKPKASISPINLPDAEKEKKERDRMENGCNQ
ncbi:hypothetical protein BaRGS_00034836 [Batillaria attramentaria]|uniref:Uncharacterized protein n=1 Tax=Batillaria attramentaria TaxID=370345 RepID=A0ABD0JGH5_9CAEN